MNELLDDIKAYCEETTKECGIIRGWFPVNE